MVFWTWNLLLNLLPPLPFPCIVMQTVAAFLYPGHTAHLILVDESKSSKSQMVMENKGQTWDGTVLQAQTKGNPDKNLAKFLISYNLWSLKIRNPVAK